MANPTHLIFPIPRNKKKFFHRLPLSEESRSVAAAAAPPILFSSSFLFLTGDDQSTSPSKPGGRAGAESQRKEANFLFSRKRENWFWRRRRNGVSLLFLFFRDPLMIPFLFPFLSSPRAFVKADLPETNKKEGRNEILLTESTFTKEIHLHGNSSPVFKTGTSMSNFRARPTCPGLSLKKEREKKKKSWLKFLSQISGTKEQRDLLSRIFKDFF